MIRRLVLWLDDRLGAASWARKALRKAFPDHWSFMIGEIALYCFVILVLTGVFLTFFYVGSTREVVYNGPYKALKGVTMSAAYRSVLKLSFEVRAGLVMRQIHHWAALVFVASITLHALRVFFTGAFRRPRELNWMIGVSLLILAIVEGFTGYSLPDDLLSGTGLRIMYSVLLSVPVVGRWLAFLFASGEYPTTELVSRLEVMHIMIFPALIAGAIGAHMAVLWRQKHTQFPGPTHTERNVVGSPFWPKFVLKSIGLGLIIFGVLALLAGLFQINPIWLYGPYDPATVTAPAQPDWYMGWLEGALRLFPAWEIRIWHFTIPEPFWPTVFLPGVFFTGLFLWPFIERRITGDNEPQNLLDRARDAAGRTAFGAAMLAFMLVLTFAGSNDVLSNLFHVRLESITNAFRFLAILLPPVVGAVTYVLARDVRKHDVKADGEPALLVRTSEGGFEEIPKGDR